MSEVPNPREVGGKFMVSSSSPSKAIVTTTPGSQCRCPPARTSRRSHIWFLPPSQGPWPTSAPSPVEPPTTATHLPLRRAAREAGSPHALAR